MSRVWTRLPKTPEPVAEVVRPTLTRNGWAGAGSACALDLVVLCIP